MKQEVDFGVVISRMENKAWKTTGVLRRSFHKILPYKTEIYILSLAVFPVSC
jgi:hypothetical protein